MITKTNRAGREVRSGKGFTLLEILLVLLIGAVIAMVVIPGMVNPGIAVVAAADQLRTDLRFAQSLALSNNTATWSVFVENGAYQLLRDGQPAPIEWPGANTTLRILPGAVRITMGTGTLTLNGWGAPAADRVFTLSDGVHTETVTMLGFTGLVP